MLGNEMEAKPICLLLAANSRVASAEMVLVGET